MKTLTSFLVVSFVLALYSRPLHADEAGDVIILFDQSMSMKKHDPESISKTRLMAFIETFGAPYKVVFAGFDEKVREPRSVILSDSATLDVLFNGIDATEPIGLTTDLEMPLRYLLERGDYERIKMALIISDGEPEIWDKELEYLSRRVLLDLRYRDINKRYRDLETSLPQNELFEQLGELYHKRNLELIERRMLHMARALGDKVILWDTSGQSQYLKVLAKKSGAQYLPMSAAVNDPSLEQLGKTLLTLRSKSEVVDEPLLAEDSVVSEQQMPIEKEKKATLGAAVITRPEVAAEARVAAEAETETETEAEAETEAMIMAEAEAHAKAEVEARAETEAETETEAMIMAEAEAQAKAEVEARAEAEAEAEAETGAVAETEARIMAEAEAEAKAEAEARMQADAAARADARGRELAEERAK